MSTEQRDKEFSGGNVNYYLVEVKEPKRLAPYTAECEDIIETLEMTFAEGEAFKALWRSCNMRAHGHGKRGQDDHGVYDGDKIAHYGESVKRSRRRKAKAKDVRDDQGRIVAKIEDDVLQNAKKQIAEMKDKHEKAVRLHQFPVFESSPLAVNARKVEIGEEGIIVGFGPNINPK